MNFPFLWPRFRVRECLRKKGKKRVVCYSFTYSHSPHHPHSRILQQQGGETNRGLIFFPYRFLFVGRRIELQWWGRQKSRLSSAQICTVLCTTFVTKKRIGSNIASKKKKKIEMEAPQVPWIYFPPFSGFPNSKKVGPGGERASSASSCFAEKWRRDP